MLCLAALAQAYSFAAIRSATMIVVTFVGTDGILRSPRSAGGGGRGNTK